MSQFPDFASACIDGVPVPPAGIVADVPPGLSVTLSGDPKRAAQFEFLQAIASSVRGAQVSAVVLLLKKMRTWSGPDGAVAQRGYCVGVVTELLSEAQIP